MFPGCGPFGSASRSFMSWQGRVRKKRQEQENRNIRSRPPVPVIAKPRRGCGNPPPPFCFWETTTGAWQTIYLALLPIIVNKVKLCYYIVADKAMYWKTQLAGEGGLILDNMNRYIFCSNCGCRIDASKAQVFFDSKSGKPFCRNCSQNSSISTAKKVGRVLLSILRIFFAIRFYIFSFIFYGKCNLLMI